jgi:hypothetical protein
MPIRPQGGMRDTLSRDGMKGSFGSGGKEGDASPWSRTAVGPTFHEGRTGVMNNSLRRNSSDKRQELDEEDFVKSACEDQRNNRCSLVLSTL